MSDTNAGLPPLNEFEDQDLYVAASGYFNKLWPEGAPYDTGTVREIWFRLRRERQLADSLRRLAEVEAANKRMIEAINWACGCADTSRIGIIPWDDIGGGRN